jgi:hypothetical protein
VQDFVVDLPGELEGGEAEVGGDEEEADEGACWCWELGSALYVLLWSWSRTAEGEERGGGLHTRKGESDAHNGVFLKI